MLPKRKQTHLSNFDYANPHSIYFVTICAHERQPYFLNKNVTKLIVDEIDYRVNVIREVSIPVYCIMPDHLHMLLKLQPIYGRTLQNWISAFKRYTAREINDRFSIRPVWQKNFYEHIVRKEESLENIVNYIVFNPVRKNLVKDWCEYPYSKMSFEDF